MSAADPVITMEGITRSFDEVPVLRGWTSRCKQGEYVAIVGPSGSGKSTLLNVLGCLDRPTSGRYELDGVETTRLDERHRAAVRSAKIGFVFQAFHLLPHLPIEDNVALAESYRHGQLGVRRSDRKARAIEQLDRGGVGSPHRLPAPPALGRRAPAGGHRPGPAGPTFLLLCDEPTGSLDTANTRAVLELFDELRARDSPHHPHHHPRSHRGRPGGPGGGDRRRHLERKEPE